MKFNKEKLKGFDILPPGITQVRLDGFEPQWTKAKDSYNLRPILTVINNANAELNDGKHRVMGEWLNSGAGWVMIEFVHGFGEMLTGEEQGVAMENWASPDVGLPGEFLPDQLMPDDPTKFRYVGPLLGKVATVELVQVPAWDRNIKGPSASKLQTAIKKYFCAVPGCLHAHLESLQK